MGRPIEIDRDAMKHLLLSYVMTPDQIAVVMECSRRSIYNTADELGIDMKSRSLIMRRTQKINQLNKEIQQLNYEISHRLHSL